MYPFATNERDAHALCFTARGMASATGNSDNAATSTAEASSQEYLKEFYEQISTDSNRKISHSECQPH